MMLVLKNSRLVERKDSLYPALIHGGYETPMTVTSFFPTRPTALLALLLVTLGAVMFVYARAAMSLSFQLRRTCRSTQIPNTIAVRRWTAPNPPELEVLGNPTAPRIRTAVRLRLTHPGT